MLTSYDAASTGTPHIPLKVCSCIFSTLTSGQSLEELFKQRVSRIHETTAKKKSTKRRGWYTKEGMERKLHFSKSLSGISTFTKTSSLISDVVDFLLTVGL